MAINYNQQIVTDGLVLHLDAGNPKSYSPNVHPYPTDLYSWATSGNNITLSRDTGHVSPVGSTPLKMVQSGTDGYTSTYGTPSANLAPALQGETWTVSVWVKASANIQIEGPWIAEANSSGAYLGGGGSPFPTLIANTWTRVSATYTTSNASCAYVQVRLDGPNPSSTVTMWWDGIQLERSSTASNFNPTANSNGVNWWNAAQSSSRAYARGYPRYTPLYGGAITTPINQVATYVELPEAVLQALPYGYFWTMEWTITIPDTSQFGGVTTTRYGPHMSVSGGNDFIWMYSSTDMSLFSGTLVSGANATWTVNVPMILTLTRAGSSWRLYKNGVFAAEYSLSATDTKLIQAWILDQEADALKGGFDAGQNLYAHWHRLSFYNKVLSDAEILQNVNAKRLRYGI